MVTAYFYSCEKGLSYAKDMFKDSCNLFEPTSKATNTNFLKELHDNFTNSFNPKHPHAWRIVNDMTKTHKRISGNRNFFLCFETEKQLDEFYSKHKEIIINSKIRLS